MKHLSLPFSLCVLWLAISTVATAQYTGTYPDVATFKYATASDSLTSDGPSKAVDDDLNTYCSIPGDAPQWLQIDLGSFHTVDGFGIVLPDDTELPLLFHFQGGPYGTYWSTMLFNVSVSSSGSHYYDVPRTDSVRFIRILMNDKDLVATFAQVYVYGEKMTTPTPPTAYPATNVTHEGFTASWSERVSASGYRLSVTTDPDFKEYVPGYQNLDVGNVLSYDVTGLSPVSTFYYRVRSYNITGTGNNSNQISVTTSKAPQTITFDSLQAYEYGDSSFVLSAQASSGLPVSYSSSNPAVVTISDSTATIQGIGTATITASQGGNTEYEAAVPVERELVIDRRALTVTGTIAADKEYDGTMLAELSGATLVGVVGMEEVTLENDTSGMFAHASAGTDIPVSTTMTITGADTANYHLMQPEGLAADILPKPLTVTGAAAENKVYDGHMEAVVSGAVLEGVIADDTVTLANADQGTFAQADVGTGIAVSTSMSLEGADIDNYSLLEPSGLTADITPRDLTVTAENKSREECAENPPFTIAYSGFADGEDAGVLDSAPEASCTADGSSPAGTYDITVSGGSAANYALSYVNGTLTIIQDFTDPVVSVRNITVELDENDQAVITPGDLVLSASDNCSVVDTTLSQSAFNDTDVGTVSVDVTVLDEAGNTATETAVVAVEKTTGLGTSAGTVAKFYPNPTTGLVHLETGIAADELKVMDMTGKTVIRIANVREEEVIDLTEYHSGIYFFQLKAGDAFFHQKVVKK